ncbi:hypothetical protein scyTo_0011457 [Scyliorhinus torazame]|uniref:Uncharacterized protein n=1 Tax=Scyliorhinus torazame TaxID=75743 RepID=A0A401NNE7_SCYTO|nr:hypothetical protein [Scyliorhinus torazame]
MRIAHHGDGFQFSHHLCHSHQQACVCSRRTACYGFSPELNLSICIDMWQLTAIFFSYLCWRSMPKKLPSIKFPLYIQVDEMQDVELHYHTKYHPQEDRWKAHKHILYIVILNNCRKYIENNFILT